MKNSSLVIKIALGISVAATLFSLVTLIRCLIIGSSVVFPIIQVVGSAAVFTVCFLMVRSLKADDEDEEEIEESPAKDDDAASDETEKTVDELYEKYHLSDFEEKNE